MAFYSRKCCQCEDRHASSQGNHPVAEIHHIRMPHSKERQTSLKAATSPLALSHETAQKRMHTHMATLNTNATSVQTATCSSSALSQNDNAWHMRIPVCIASMKKLKMSGPMNAAGDPWSVASGIGITSRALGDQLSAQVIQCYTVVRTHKTRSSCTSSHGDEDEDNERAMRAGGVMYTYLCTRSDSICM